MTISPLTTVSLNELLSTFNSAFSDYQIKIEETLPEFITSNIQRGIDYSASFGSFSDDGKLTGFILCGVRTHNGVLQFYDGSTGIIPSHRGQGLGTLLLEKALEEAQSRKAQSFILEVLQDNQKAKSLYERNGFTVSRYLSCIQKNVTEISCETTRSGELYSPDIQQFFKVVETLAPLSKAAWQNSFSSIAAMYDSLNTKILYRDGSAVGYIVFNPVKGSIYQIGAQENSLSIINELIGYAGKNTSSDSLKFINLEKPSPLLSLLENDGWTLFVDQYEMIKYL